MKNFRDLYLEYIKKDSNKTIYDVLKECLIFYDKYGF